MSRDSSRTHLHLHAPRHADLFEDFTTPLHLLHTTSFHPSNSHSHSHSPFTATTTTSSSNPHTAHTTTSPRPNNPANQYQHLQHGATLSGTALPLASGNTPQLPPEDLYIPAQYMPINPEEEDDVVPDQTAAFGITRAMAGGGAGERERGWRDVDSLDLLLRGTGLGEGVELEVNGMSGIGGGRRVEGGSVVGRGGTPAR